MGVAQRKEREKEFKRGLILEAAEELILEKGHDQFNMDEVAERAEVSKGTLYLYFTSKTDLIFGIVHKASIMLNAKIAEVLTRDIPGIELVHNIAVEYLNFVHEHPEFYGAMRFYENLRDSKEEYSSEYFELCETYAQQGFSYTIRAIQIGMQDGTIDKRYDPKELALLIWASSKGMVNLSYLQRSSHHLEFLDGMDIKISTLFDHFMDFLENGIASTKKPND